VVGQLKPEKGLLLVAILLAFFVLSRFGASTVGADWGFDSSSLDFCLYSFRASPGVGSFSLDICGAVYPDGSEAGDFVFY